MAAALVSALLAGAPLAGRGAVAPRRAAPAAARPTTPPASRAPAVATDSAGAEAPLLIPGRPGAQPGGGANLAAQVRDFMMQGLALENAGQPAAAIVSYRNALKLDPNVPDANLRMGRLFMGVHQVSVAVDCFTQEVARHPLNSAAGRELGLALLALGDPARAERQFDILTRRNSNDAESWDGLAQAMLSQGRTREAETAVRRAIRLAPRHAPYARDLGVVLAAAGRTTEARAAYHRAQVLDPKDPGAWINVANLEARAGNFEEALAQYQEALRRDSTSSIAFQGELAAMHALGRDAESGAMYRNWLHARPDDVDARLAAVQHFIEVDRRDIAVELARDGVRVDPTSGDAHLVLGIALGASGDARGGLGEMRRAESMFRDAAGRSRVRAAIAAARRGAPDSLRALYEADSLAHPVPRAPISPKRGVEP